ncbi:GLC7-interacting protein 2 [Ancistrocladus abbreviatus]
MATPVLHHFLFLFLLMLTSAATSTAKFRPKALVLPVSKDSATHLYTTKINQRTPLVSVPVTLHLGGRFLWVLCLENYTSSTYRPAYCGSTPCSLARSHECGQIQWQCKIPEPPSPGCHNNTCGQFPDNPITISAVGGEVASDLVSIQSTDGSNPGRAVTVPHFIFVCGFEVLLFYQPSGVRGVAGLGQARISLPSQFSSAFGFPRKFALCLSSSTKSNGVVFFGNGPYNFLPGIDASKSLLYTPIFINPVSTTIDFKGEKSSDYFIGVTSIKINGREVPINKTLLSIDSEGNGGTKISTVNPYSVLQTSIYNALVKVFAEELKGVKSVAAVKPFKLCYRTADLRSTRVGPAVPEIDLVLQSESVYWRIFGANSMVAVSDKVVCLGAVDGGENPMTAIVIGGHQLEDNLLEFDLANHRLGFSSSLLFKQTSCANFNFTSVV